VYNCNCIIVRLCYCVLVMSDIFKAWLMSEMLLQECMDLITTLYAKGVNPSQASDFAVSVVSQNWLNN
jgi:hypothetical protein